MPQALLAGVLQEDAVVQYLLLLFSQSGPLCCFFFITIMFR